MEVVGGIYNFNHYSSRWLTALLMGTPDMHCSLSGECHVSRPLGFGAVDLEDLCPFAVPENLVAHETVRCDLTSQTVF
jgi:hypothetical protein